MTATKSLSQCAPQVTSAYPFALPNNTLRCQTLLPTRGPIFSNGSLTDRGANSLLCFLPLLSQWCEKWADGELDTGFCCSGSIFAFLKGKHTPMRICVFVFACVWCLLCGHTAEFHTCRLKWNKALSLRAKFICSLLLWDSLLQSLLSDFKILETLRVPQFTDIIRPEVTCQLDCNCTTEALVRINGIELICFLSESLLRRSGPKQAIISLA